MLTKLYITVHNSTVHTGTLDLYGVDKLTLQHFIKLTQSLVSLITYLITKYE